ncbi:hypothetical protein B0H19DRAFT_1077796 [Mycena capillaripes]|nr:hypothetical protein B0H19DRAFT_1077796 [Mycena capillaripes]
MNLWKARPRVRGESKTIQDGKVWNTIKGVDGEKFFFRPGCEDEIRVGVTFSLGWFGRKTSNYGPSHSSGVMSFCIQNLLEAERYRAGNLILSGMPPGPHEATAEQLQHHLKIIVDDLIMLHEEGIIIKTPEYPNAMCKLCGFADHAHTVSPCPKCHVPQAALFSKRSLRNEYPPRDGEKHRQLCYEYAALETTKEKEIFFSKHGVRWTEFARLKYFVLVRYTVIDPMHNLLLSVAKTQWYTQWIKTNTLRADTGKFTRELFFIHDFLSSVLNLMQYEAPLWAGKLPQRVGEPAGGALTADEYKMAVTGPWAIIMPIVWERFLEEANNEYKAAMRKYKREGKSKGDAEPSPRMVEGEDEKFLRFAMAPKMIVGRSIQLDKLPRIKSLLQDYLLTYMEIYGSQDLKSNHHWAIHIPDQLVDYGSVYNFWAFLTEQLNKPLKNINSNNWTGGALEVSMMRGFHRNAAVDSAMYQGLSTDEGLASFELESSFIHLLVGQDTNTEALEFSVSRVKFGQLATRMKPMDDDTMRLGLLQYYNRKGPQVHLNPREQHGFQNTSYLLPYADVYDYALLDGRRITPTTRSTRNTAGSSIIQGKSVPSLSTGNPKSLAQKKPCCSWSHG